MSRAQTGAFTKGIFNLNALPAKERTSVHPAPALSKGRQPAICAKIDQQQTKKFTSFAMKKSKRQHPTVNKAILDALKGIKFNEETSTSEAQRKLLSSELKKLQAGGDSCSEICKGGLSLLDSFVSLRDMIHDKEIKGGEATDENPSVNESEGNETKLSAVATQVIRRLVLHSLLDAACFTDEYKSWAIKNLPKKARKRHANESSFEFFVGDITRILSLGAFVLPPDGSLSAFILETTEKGSNELSQRVQQFFEIGKAGSELPQKAESGKKRKRPSLTKPKNVRVKQAKQEQPPSEKLVNNAKLPRQQNNPHLSLLGERQPLQAFVRRKTNNPLLAGGRSDQRYVGSHFNSKQISTTTLFREVKTMSRRPLKNTNTQKPATKNKNIKKQLTANRDLRKPALASVSNGCMHVARRNIRNSPKKKSIRDTCSSIVAAALRSMKR